MWDKNLQLNALINYRQLSKLTVPVCRFVVCKTLELKISQQPENLIKVFFFRSREPLAHAHPPIHPSHQNQKNPNPNPPAIPISQWTSARIWPGKVLPICMASPGAEQDGKPLLGKCSVGQLPEFSNDFKGVI